MRRKQDKREGMKNSDIDSEALLIKALNYLQEHSKEGRSP